VVGRNKAAKRLGYGFGLADNRFQVVARGWDREQPGAGGNQAQGGAQFVKRAERVGGAVNEQSRRAQLREECRAQLLGLAGGMERIRKQQERLG